MDLHSATRFVDAVASSRSATPGHRSVVELSQQLSVACAGSCGVLSNAQHHTLRQVGQSIQTLLDSSRTPVDAVAGAIALDGFVRAVHASSNAINKPDRDSSSSSSGAGDQIKELCGLCTRLISASLVKCGNAAARYGGSESSGGVHANTPTAAAAAHELVAVCLPTLTAVLKALTLLPIPFRRLIPDVILLCSLLSRIGSPSFGLENTSTAVGNSSDGLTSVASLACRCIAQAVLVALRTSKGTGKAEGGAGAGASSSSSASSSTAMGGLATPPLDLSGLIRWLLDASAAHSRLLHAVAAYAPVTVPSDIDACAGLVGLLPQDGIAYAKASDALLASVAGGASDGAAAAATAGSRSSSSSHLAGTITARACAYITVARHLISRHGISAPAGLPCESVVLPLPAMLSHIEQMTDAAAGILSAAHSIQAASASAAMADDALRSSLSSSAAAQAGTGLTLLCALFSSFPAPMRRYRTHVARVLGRLTLQLWPQAGGTGEGGRKSLQPNSTDGARLQSTLLHVFSTWLTSVGIGQPSSVSCPEALSLVSHLTDVCWRVMAFAAAASGGADDAATSAVPLTDVLTCTHALVSCASAVISDANRFRIEQAALSLLQAWPLQKGSSATGAAGAPDVTADGGSGVGRKRARTAAGAAALATLTAADADVECSSSTFHLLPAADAVSPVLLSVMATGTSASTTLPPALLLPEAARAAVVALLAVCLATPWQGGAVSPLSPLLHATLVHAGRHASGSHYAPLVAAVVSSTITVAAIPVQVLSELSSDRGVEGAGGFADDNDVQMTIPAATAVVESAAAPSSSPSAANVFLGQQPPSSSATLPSSASTAPSAAAAPAPVIVSAPAAADKPQPAVLSVLPAPSAPVPQVVSLAGFGTLAGPAASRTSVAAAPSSAQPQSSGAAVSVQGGLSAASMAHLTSKYADAFDFPDIT